MIGLNIVSTIAIKTKNFATNVVSGNRTLLNVFGHSTPANLDAVHISPAKLKEIKLDRILQEGKEKVLKALNSETPHEYQVIIDGERIIKEIKGNSDKVPTSGLMTKFKLYNPDNKLITMHGHPTQKNGVTPPISFQDFESMNKLSGEHKCIVYNQKGQHSILTKEDAFSELSKEEFKKISERFTMSLFKSLPIEEQRRWIKLIKAAESDPKKYSELDKKLSEIITNQQFTESGTEAVHRFWQENASTLKLRYETNYDCFDHI